MAETRLSPGDFSAFEGDDGALEWRTCTNHSADALLSNGGMPEAKFVGGSSHGNAAIAALYAAAHKIDPANMVGDTPSGILGAIKALYNISVPTFNPSGNLIDFFKANAGKSFWIAVDAYYLTGAVRDINHFAAAHQHPGAGHALLADCRSDGFFFVDALDSEGTPAPYVLYTSADAQSVHTAWSNWGKYMLLGLVNGSLAPKPPVTLPDGTILMYGGTEAIANYSVIVAGAHIRTAPNTAATLLNTQAGSPVGTIFSAFQVTDSGEYTQGSSRWYGDKTGQKWIHSSLVKLVATPAPTPPVVVPTPPVVVPTPPVVVPTPPVVVPTPPVVTPPAPPALTYRVAAPLSGEVCERMAARLLGSSNRYREIINLNTRAYPASDGNPATTAILGPNYWLMMGKYYRIPLK